LTGGYTPLFFEQVKVQPLSQYEQLEGMQIGLPWSSLPHLEPAQHAG
jgi:hypothetical protein